MAPWLVALAAVRSVGIHFRREGRAIATRATDDSRPSSRRRRIARDRTPDFDAVMSWLAGHTHVRRLVIDLDNTLTPYHASDKAVLRTLSQVGRRLEHEAPWLKEVLVLSNGRRDILIADDDFLHYRARARKPFSRRVGGQGRASTVVCGDQVLTDGLLAWRLRCTFLHLVLADRHEPAWPRLMRWIGRLLSRYVFLPPTEARPGSDRR